MGHGNGRHAGGDGDRLTAGDGPVQKRILLINPNTSPRITDILAGHAQRIAGAHADVVAVTAPFGAAALETPADLTIATQAVLQVIAQNSTCDAAIIGAFGDPGLNEASATAKMPVYGLGRSGLLDAARDGRRFAIVTVGPTMRPAIEHAVAKLGLASNLVMLHFLEQGVLAVANDRLAILDAAVQAALDCAETYGAEAVLFGGAPFAGIGLDIDSRLPIPALDGLTSAMRLAVNGGPGAVAR